MKSYVTMEQKVCGVCTKTYDTNSILMDKRLKESFETYTTTGFGLCEEDQQKKDNGFIALIGCDPNKTKISNDNTTRQEDAHRTGDIIHIKSDTFNQMFNAPTPEGGVVFIEQAIIERLKEVHAKC